ncbi:MAG: protein translocase SEC61 complex subunit gamma [Candidatus Pacearchaeota archaeon]
MNVKNFLNNQKESYLRIWRVMRKPTMEETKKVSKITAIGVLILGAIGFLINLLFILMK